ncbi:hypothetical protein JTB14_026257 [Gonioctena quinquepunctata]|nr:hypothetical protein JTB14_026257 [Gonioctena quinquepunctata]
MNCSICNIIKQPTKDIKNPCFQCDSCRNLICVECINLQKRTLKYNCKKCRNHEFAELLQNTISDKEKIIKDQETIIKLLNEKMENLEQSTKLTYADALQQIPTPKPAKINIPKIIMKPKSQRPTHQIKRDLETNINLAELEIGITNMKTTTNELDTLKQAIEINLKDEYEIKMSELRQPRIKIVGYTQEHTQEKIENCIEKQNDSRGEIKVNFFVKTEMTPKQFFAKQHQMFFIKY